MPKRAERRPRTERDRQRARAAHLGPERRRPLVLDAALQLFVEHGYRGTSMEEIARVAGVTKPVVYECYASKEELFGSLLEREEQRLLETVYAALPEEPSFDDVEKLFREALGAFLSAAGAAPDSWRVIFDSEHGSEPAIAKRVQRGRGNVLARLQQLVEGYMEQAGVEDAQRKSPVVAEIVVSMAEASTRLLLRGKGGWDARELSRFVARLAIRGAQGL